MSAGEQLIDESIVRDLIDLNREGGDPNFLADLIVRFESLSDEKIRALEAALTGDDRKAIVSLAHSLKGSSANMGAMTMSTICARLQNEGATASTETLTEQIGELTRIAPRSVQAIRDFIATA